MADSRQQKKILKANSQKGMVDLVVDGQSAVSGKHHLTGDSKKSGNKWVVESGLLPCLPQDKPPRAPGDL